MFFSKVPSVSWHEISKSDRILDVREKYEFSVKSVPGSKNVPLSNIDRYEADHKIYVVCQSGMRSKRAVKILKKKGIDAINIKGGMNAYGK